VASSTPRSPSASPVSSPAPTPSLRSPLTGLPVDALRPVLIAKIGNIPRERPPIGLSQADVVYVEMVEGGLTRLAAVFSSRMPERVGPVRSARETDADLLRPYGEAAFAYSGSDRAVLPLLRRSPLRLLSFDANLLGYRRDPSRGYSPYNVVGDTAVLLARAGAVARAHDVGFRFGPWPAAGVTSPAVARGRAVSTMTARWPTARLTAAWDAPSHRWLILMDGSASVDADGTRLTAATVLVQYVEESYLARHDSSGASVPFAHTTGSGTGVVLRDGRALDATWSRPKVTDDTVWSIGGTRATFAPGQLWVLLVPKGRVVSTG